MRRTIKTFNLIWARLSIAYTWWTLRRAATTTTTKKASTVLEGQLREFLAHMDELAERLTPQRRPQDRGEPECSTQELRTLAAISKRGQLRMTDVADLLEVRLSTASHTVDKLMAKGLVRRTRASADRRVVQVGLQPTRTADQPVCSGVADGRRTRVAKQAERDGAQAIDRKNGQDDAGEVMPLTASYTRDSPYQRVLSASLPLANPA